MFIIYNRITEDRSQQIVKFSILVIIVCNHNYFLQYIQIKTMKLQK